MKREWWLGKDTTAARIGGVRHVLPGMPVEDMALSLHFSPHNHDKQIIVMLITSSRSSHSISIVSNTRLSSNSPSMMPWI